MRWLPKTRKVRVAVGGIAGLLVVGALVGSEAFDGPRVASTSEADPSRKASVAGETGGGYAIAEAGSDANYGTSQMGSAPVEGQALAVGGASAADVAGTGGSIAAGGGGGEPALPPVDAGKVIKSATLDLDVKKGAFDDAHDTALRAVEDAGGFVQSSSSTPTHVSLTIRVPADSFESTLTRLRKLGEVTDEGVTGQDVTEEFVDLEARLRHWRAQEVVFLELLAKAATIAETVEVRHELSTIQQTIEQLEGRIRFLDDRTGFSTVALEMSMVGAPIPADEEEGPSLSKAWDQAWDAAVSVVGGTVITLGALIPLTGIVGIPALFIWLVMRRRRTPVAAPAG